MCHNDNNVNRISENNRNKRMRRMCSYIVLNRNKSFLIGITSGVLLSMMVMPFFEECRTPQNGHHSNWYQQIVYNDYDPIVRINGVKLLNLSEDMIKLKHKMIRPHYYTTELDVKDNLLIGVLCGDDTNSMAEAINKTLSDSADRIIYFSESSTMKRLTSDVSSFVYLPNVPLNIKTPKYLKILEYLFNAKYINNYNFVFLISDRTYVNGDKLENLISNFSMSHYVFETPFISQSSADDDTENDNSDVILDSGVIFSSTLLLKCNSDVNCLKMYHNKYTRKLSFMSYHITSTHMPDDFTMNINHDIFIKSISTYPITNVNHYYQLHLLWCRYSYSDTLKELKTFENDIIQNNDNEIVEYSWPIGIEAYQKPLNRFDVNRWSYFNESHAFMPNDFEVIVPLSELQKEEIALIKSHIIEWLKNKYSNYNPTDGMNIINIYKRFDAIRGIEYIFDVRLRTFPVIKRIQLLKPLNKIELIPNVPYVTENSRIVMILPIRSVEEIDSASSYLNHYAISCLTKHNHHTVLLLILIYQPNDDKDIYGHIKVQASQLQNRYKNSGAKIAWISVKSGKSHKVPCELSYIDLILKKLSVSFSNSLILHCRANMLLSIDFLNRVRLNTISGFQVFFPIPFIEYRLRSQVKPLKNFDVRKDNGYFDITNYNHGSFYLSDYSNARRVIQNALPMVKHENEFIDDIYYDSDIDIFQLFLIYNSAIRKEKKKNSLFIMRSIEPELKLKHESFTYECSYYESNKFSKENCYQRSLIGLGTKQQLASLIIDDDDHRDVQEMDDTNNNNIF